jgi:hypothetical protein
VHCCGHELLWRQLNSINGVDRENVLVYCRGCNGVTVMSRLSARKATVGTVEEVTTVVATMEAHT